jgi:hypothetical protein
MEQGATQAGRHHSQLSSPGQARNCAPGRAIQYTLTLAMNIGATGYWITRFRG